MSTLNRKYKIYFILYLVLFSSLICFVVDIYTKNIARFQDSITLDIRAVYIFACLAAFIVSSVCLITLDFLIRSITKIFKQIRNFW